MDGKQSEEKRKTPRSAVIDSRPEYERLGEWLRTQRTRSAQIQQSVADEIRKPRQFLTKVEHGRQRIDVVEFVDLFRALELDPTLTIGDLIAVLDGKSAKPS